MHFIYGSPRYSSDLDFACPTIEEDYDTIEDALRRVLVYLGDTLLALEIKKQHEMFLIAKYSHPGILNSPVVKVEIYGVPSHEHYPTGEIFTSSC